MKRIFVLLMLLALLCGCGADQPEETAAPSVSTEPVEITEPAGIYVPSSDLETLTEGAVLCYVPDASCYGFRMMEEDVLAFCGKENTSLIRYSGEHMYPIAGAKLDCRLSPDDRSFQISSNGITYFNPDSREVVFLDRDLKEVRRLEMPEEMVGYPVLSANRMQVYYCTADAICVYDTTTELNKLLKTISYPRQSVVDVLLNDSVLCCSLEDEHGQEHTLFISTETGQLLSQTVAGMEVTASRETAYAKVPEGIQELLVFGRAGENSMVLTPAEISGENWYLPQSHGLVSADIRQEKTTLDYYDLDSGRRTASVDLPARISPRCVEIRQSDGCVLVMAYDSLSDSPVILSWQKNASPTGDATVYTGPRYTAKAPDVAGLKQCRELADLIGQKYGLRILVGADAVVHQPWDYTLEMEYQTPVIHRQLEVLAQVLSNFPEGFFGKLYGEPRISIVRSIRGNAESGSIHTAQGLQFWDGECAFVALAAGDTLPGAFYHEMFHVMDSKILSETRVYYYWHNLNPDGCEYFEDYTSYQQADVSRYLQDEDRAFIDAYSMCYPKEDRARIMEYACQEGNAHYFQSEIMQKKLELLCKGIQEAFGLKDYPDALLWEQYLNKPETDQ
jgi:hypothetical protein